MGVAAIDLTTTNVLLGILATISVLQTFAVVGAFVAGYVLMRRTFALAKGIEERQLAPAATRVNAILDDVKIVSGVAKRAAERADRAAGWWRVFRRG